MPQQVEVPGHGIVEFPDGMSDDQIAAAIKKNTMLGGGPQQATQAPSFLQNMKRVLTSSQTAGGPMAMIGREGVKQIEEALQKGAYKTGGAVTDVAAGHVPPEVAGGLGWAANVGVQALPMILTGEFAKKAAPPLFKAGARSLMSSAAKPTLQQWKTGKAARAIDTMLDEGINPTAGGVDILKSRIADLNDEIATAIKGSPAMINKAKVGARLKELHASLQQQVNPQSDIETIRKAWDQFKNHPLLAGKTEIPVGLAQSMKQGTYKAIGGKNYGELKGAETEAQKALARGLKEEISSAVPNVAALNKREGNLLNALSVAERRALMDANKNPLGLGVLNPATLALWLWDRSGWAKAMTARMLYSGSEQIPATAARLAVTPALMQTGKPPALTQDYP